MSALSRLASLHQQAPPIDTGTASPALLIGLGVIAAGAFYLYSNPSNPPPAPATNPGNVISSANVKLLGPTGTTPGTLQVQGARFFCSAADAEQDVSVPLSSHARTNPMGVSSKVGGGSSCLAIQDSPALITSSVSGTCPDFMTPASNKLSPGGRLVCNLNYSSTSAKHRDISNPLLALMVPGGPGSARDSDGPQYDYSYLLDADFSGPTGAYTRPISFKNSNSSLLNMNFNGSGGPGVFSADSGSVFTDPNPDLSTYASSTNSQLLLVSAKNNSGNAPTVLDMCAPKAGILFNRPYPVYTGHRQAAMAWNDAFGSDSGFVNGLISAPNADGGTSGTLFPMFYFAKISLRGGDSVTSAEFPQPDCSGNVGASFNPQVATVNITPQYYGAVNDNDTGLYETSAGPTQITSDGGNLVWGQVVCPANARCTKTETAADGSLICSNVNSSKSGAYQISCDGADLPGDGSSNWIPEAAGSAASAFYVYNGDLASCVKNCSTAANSPFCSSTCSSDALQPFILEDPVGHQFINWAAEYGFDSTYFMTQALGKNAQTNETFAGDAFKLLPGDSYAASTNTFTFTPSLYL